MDFNFVNPNEMTKDEFDSAVKQNNWSVYTEGQIASHGVAIASILQKSVDTQSPEEKEALRVGRAELDNLTPVKVLEFKDGTLFKSLFYVTEKQVALVDTLEKSLDGTPKQKVVFLDTPLNRELGRVGMEIMKGEDKKSDPQEEMWKAIMERDDFKKACEYMEKGMGDTEAMDEMKKAYPNMSEQDYKNFKKGFARKKHSEYMEKAMSMKEQMDKD